MCSMYLTFTYVCVKFLVRHACHAFMLWAWHPSVYHLPVTLVDCDHIVQKKVEISTWQNRSVSWLPASQSWPKSLYPVILNSTEEQQWVWKNVVLCTLAACIQWIACCDTSALSHTGFLSTRLNSGSHITVPHNSSGTLVFGCQRSRRNSFVLQYK